MKRFFDFIFMVLCWVITGFIFYMGCYREFDTGPAIVIGSALLFISLVATLLFFIPEAFHRFIFGDHDQKWW
jgi:hypothetical protein